eukprot:3453103-Heterocapsa_arctica.AAC.1
MLLGEAGQAAPNLGEVNFPSLPEPLRPIGTGQGEGPAHCRSEAVGVRTTRPRSKVAGGGSHGPRPEGHIDKPKATGRRARPAADASVEQADKRPKRDSDTA